MSSRQEQQNTNQITPLANSAQNNFAGVGLALLLSAAIGGYFGYQAGQSEQFRKKMHEYRNRTSAWLKSWKEWSEKNGGVDA